MSLFKKQRPKLVVPKKGKSGKLTKSRKLEEELEEQDYLGEEGDSVEEEDIVEVEPQPKPKPKPKPIPRTNPSKVTPTERGSGVTRPHVATQPKKSSPAPQKPLTGTNRNVVQGQATSPKSDPNKGGQSAKPKPKSFTPPKTDKPDKQPRGGLGKKVNKSAPQPKKDAKVKQPKKSLFSRKTISETVVANLVMGDIIIPNNLAYSSEYTRNTKYPVNKEVVDISSLNVVEPVTQLLTKEVKGLTESIEGSLNIVEIELHEETNEEVQTFDLKVDKAQEPLPTELDLGNLDESDDTTEDTTDLVEDELEFQLQPETTTAPRDGGLEDLEDITFEEETVEHSTPLDELPETESLEFQLEDDTNPSQPTPVVPAPVAESLNILPIADSLNTIPEGLAFDEDLLDEQTPLTEEEDLVLDLEEESDADFTLDEDEGELTLVEENDDAIGFKMEPVLEDDMQDESPLSFTPVEEPTVSDSLSFEPVEATSSQSEVKEKLVLGNVNQQSDQSSTDILNSSTFKLDDFKSRLNIVKQEDDLNAEIVEREKEMASIRAVADREKQIQGTASLVEALQLAKGATNG